MSDKHTPGPWNTSREDMDSYTANEDGKYEHVVYVYRGDQPRIPVFSGKLNNARDDAALIASAPQLAEENERLRKRLLAIADACDRLTTGEAGWNFVDTIRDFHVQRKLAREAVKVKP